MDSYNAFMLEKLSPFNNSIVLRSFIKFLMFRKYYQSYVNLIPSLIEAGETIETIFYPLPSIMDSNFYTKFKYYMGKTPYEFVKKWQLYLKQDERVMHLIRDTYKKFGEELCMINPKNFLLWGFDSDNIFNARIYYKYEHDIIQDIVNNDTPALLKNTLRTYLDVKYRPDNFGKFIGFVPLYV